MPETEKSFYETNKNLVASLAPTPVILAIYAQVVWFDFINIDDDIYTTENPFVSRGVNFNNFKWALAAFHPSNWHPQTWLSHQLDASFFGLSAGGHHAVNVGFHIANWKTLPAKIRIFPKPITLWVQFAPNKIVGRKLSRSFKKRCRSIRTSRPREVI